MAMARKLPIGIQGFEKLRSEGYLYVDKTEYIHRLVREGSSYFLSRPRRFGKSLLLSTLLAYWEGKKELFEGLDIERLERDNPKAWEPYPTFYFDFNGENYQEGAALESIIDEQLQRWEDAYEISHALEDGEGTIGRRFRTLLIEARKRTGRRCVVLVDEYDKPLLESMHEQELEKRNKAVFKGFFSSLKGFDEYIQFVFITGVTKFEKVSIFSDLNQLEDISLDEEYAGICGITEEEMEREFLPEISHMAETREFEKALCMERLQRTYDGYRFSSDLNCRVYNPYSLLNALKKRKFGSYWFETGTPSFLTKRLRDLCFDVRQFSNKSIYATERILSDYRADDPDPIPLLFQTGYLTIVDYDQKKEYYTLGLPNEEVKYAFMESLVPEYVNGSGAGSGKDILTLVKHVENGNLEKILEIIAALFAGIPYTTQDAPFEHYFQTVIYLVFTLLDQFVFCEIHTWQGRIDCIVKTDRFIYLFEFKRDDTADAALRQIEDMGYALPYLTDHRKLYKIGVSFDSKKRMLTDWKAAEG